MDTKWTFKITTISSFFLKPFSSSFAFISSLPFSEQVSYKHTPGFVEFIQRHLSIKNHQIHSQLQSNMVEHVGIA